MSDPKQRFSQDGWTETVEALDLEIARLCVMCHIRILDPGVLERVLANDRSLSSEHETAFDTLRGLLVLHYRTQEQIATELCAVDAESLRLTVFKRLRERVGEQLGGMQDSAGEAPSTDLP